MPSFFKSPAGKKEILALYDQKLTSLGIECTSLEVHTQFGKTHILKTGNPQNPPLMIIHGSNGCAPIGLEAYPRLSQHFEVYAIDVLAQPNKSEGERPSMKTDAYGQWMDEVIKALDLKDLTLVGFSFGGLIILKTLLYNEAPIKSAYLASPAFIVNGNPLKALFKVFIPMRRFIKTQKVKYVEQFLQELFTDRDPFAIAYLTQVFQHFEMDFTPVPTIKGKEANQIKTPITLIAAGKDLLFPGKKMLRRAKSIFPSLQATHLLQDSKHVQAQQHNAFIEKIILEKISSKIQA